ncbi:voltage-gated potassium channel protein [Salmonella enterica subsp. enterica serovar Montevideo]|nr:voltage-gated potassium channel protein [Salmonella enterica subsp. enterica serovar Montevideo]EEK7814082.1 voltage-gated potassium channel protein [Salmonella enterica subsp. enterica serovar Montevideo]
MNIISQFKNKAWAPSCLAIMIALNGFSMMQSALEKALSKSFMIMLSDGHIFNEVLKASENLFALFDIPRFMVGILLFLLAVVVLLRNRIAWSFSLLLLVGMVIMNLTIFHDNYLQTIFSTVTIVSLIFFWKEFNQYSLASGTYFSVISIFALIVYSCLGAIYLGDQFSPHIKDLTTAFYFAIVCMSTVGFGDIVPHTPVARIFTLSIIIFGVTVFAASVASIAGPAISKYTQRISKGRVNLVNRENHFIIIGYSPLAQNIFKLLTQQGISVTVICPEEKKRFFPDNADVIEGISHDSNVLKQAGIVRAKAVMMLSESDSENILTLLSAKNLLGEKTQIITSVNESNNFDIIKQLKPDIIFSLPLLGSELLTRTLMNERIDESSIISMFFGKNNILQNEDKEV